MNTTPNNQPLVSTKIELYLSERRELINAGLKSTESFDKSILAYSSGAIAISITFLDEIASSPINCKCLLLICWIFFILCIFSTTISFLTSQKAFEKQIKILEELFFQDKPSGENVFSRITQSLNYASSASFTIAVIFLVIFAYLNID